jgi:dCMP deaminase
MYSMKHIVARAEVSTTSDPESIDTWEQYWLEMAVTAGRKSKDPKCRVGAVIVRDDLVLSTGFNGFARQVFDDPALLRDPDEKLKWICHAEQNAIHNAARLGVRLEGATIFVTKFPCLACCNAIIQAGIREIHTHDSKYWNDDPADRDHTRKRSTLRQAHIKVSAPFHPDYAPKAVTGKRAPATTASTGEARPLLPALSNVPSPPRHRTKRTPKVGSETMSLFPARRPVRGGKSGS